ncbi:hypothetical protein Tco_1088754, partial [Tanacetum coccineum]
MLREEDSAAFGPGGAKGLINSYALDGYVSCCRRLSKREREIEGGLSQVCNVTNDNQPLSMCGEGVLNFIDLDDMPR